MFELSIESCPHDRRTVLANSADGVGGGICIIIIIIITITSITIITTITIIITIIIIIIISIIIITWPGRRAGDGPARLPAKSAARR